MNGRTNPYCVANVPWTRWPDRVTRFQDEDTRWHVHESERTRSRERRHAAWAYMKIVSQNHLWFTEKLRLGKSCMKLSVLLRNLRVSRVNPLYPRFHRQFRQAEPWFSARWSPVYAARRAWTNVEEISDTLSDTKSIRKGLDRLMSSMCRGKVLAKHNAVCYPC